jgi:UDP-N-acetylmuramoylalanine-D-glutamate ligase
MTDDDLFQREDHPARQVLNRLARLGFRDHPLTREQEQDIGRLVEDIAQGFDSEPEVFDKALGVLEPMVKRQEVSYQRNLERVRQLAEGEHRLESARQRVNRRWMNDWQANGCLSRSSRWWSLAGETCW